MHRPKPDNRTLRVRTAFLLSFTTVFAALFILLTSDQAAAQTRPAGGPNHVIIGIDISVDSPFLTDDQFAAKTGRRIARRISVLPPRSTVTLRSFASHSTTDQTLEINRTITTGQSAQRTAEFIEKIVAGVPTLVRNGRLKAQDESNIVGFLESQSRGVDCAARRTVIVLATDGVEQSEYADLKTDQALPAPRSPIFDQCARLEMLGMGRGHGSPALTARLVAAWNDWAGTAGFLTFVGLDTW